MKKFKLKVLATSLSAVLMVGSAFAPSASAFSFDGIIVSTMGAVIAGSAPKILGNLWEFISSFYTSRKNSSERKFFQGYRDPQEIVNNLKKVAENKSEIKVYGQEKAKEQMMDVLSSVVARIDTIKRTPSDVKEIRGNIVYLIGPSGTGKTKMTSAIASAFLKHPEKTCIFCHSESITRESELGTQLFKTITSKDIGEKRSKNIFGNDGLTPKDEESPMLKHLLNWCEAVVVIDEYEKMKEKSAKPGTVMNIPGVGNIPMAGAAAGSGPDKTADEILRSIASTGKYKFMNKEVDCSKVLFLITTNETKEELESNFGIGGVKGGGVQRLNVIEFSHLTLEACRGIVSDVVDEVTKVLTDAKGPFKVKSIEFEKKSCEDMAKYIFEDKMLQGRAKNKLEDKIYSLFSKDIGKDNGKQFKVSFVPASEDLSEHFAKQTL